MLQGWVGAGTEAEVSSDLYWHRIIETFKYAYAKRTGLGDENRPADPEIPYSITEVSALSLLVVVIFSAFIE